MEKALARGFERGLVSTDRRWPSAVTGAMRQS
jgi:hypothetical protein